LGKTRKATLEVPDEAMNKSRIVLIAVFVLVLIVVGYLAAVYLPFHGRPPRDDQDMIRVPSPEELRMFFMVRGIISTVNAGLVIFLLLTYVQIYVKTRAKFTMGLIIFTIALLLYAATSNPLLHVMFGPYSPGFFEALPELFTTIAVVIMLYLSMK
jgi:hypothetical protein